MALVAARGLYNRKESALYKSLFLLLGSVPLLIGTPGAALGVAQNVAPASPVYEGPPPMPAKTSRTGKHVNRIIDMWLKSQPVYETLTFGGGYAEGKALANTQADTRKSLA